MPQLPLNDLEFEREFGKDEQCLQYLVIQREELGLFTCNKCGSKRAWLIKNHIFECKDCNRQVSILSGTIYQKSRIPLKAWFKAIWSITKLPVLDNVTNASNLRWFYNMTYKTAWVWHHNLKRIMIHPELDRFSGDVLANKTEILVPGIKKIKNESKVPIAIILEKNDGRAKKIRIGLMSDQTKESLENYGTNCVRPGNKIGYFSVEKSLKSVAKDFKIWLEKFPPKSYSLKYLQSYFDEYAFRYNNQNENRKKLFDKLLKNAVQTEPMTYHDIIRKIETMH